MADVPEPKSSKRGTGRRLRSSERSLLEALVYVEANLRDPLTPVLEKEHMATLFLGFDDLRALSEEIVFGLEQVEEGKRALSSVFEAVNSRLVPLYERVLDNRFIALHLYANLVKSTSSKPAKAIAKIYAASNRITYPDYLELIAKRPEELCAILKSMKSSASKESEGYESLKQLTKSAIRLCENTKSGGRCRDDDDITRLEKVQSMLVDIDLTKPFRKFIGSQSLFKISESAVQERMFFLFNDVLIYAKKEGDTKYFAKGVIDLGKSWVRVLKDAPKVSNLLQVVGPEKTFTMYANTQGERDDFARLISLCIAYLEEIHPETSLQKSPVMCPEPSGLGHLRTIHPRDFDPEGYGKVITVESGKEKKKRRKKRKTEGDSTKVDANSSESSDRLPPPPPSGHFPPSAGDLPPPPPPPPPPM